MTALIGGSLLMIAAASIALVFGWLGADPTLMWVSIGSSVAASVLLALGYNRSRIEVAAASRELARRTRPAGTTPPGTSPAVAATPAMAPPASATPASIDAPYGVGSAGEDTGLFAVDLDDDEDEVIANPERNRFHRPECRYAKVAGTVPMSPTAARGRGYVACGICKP